MYHTYRDKRFHSGTMDTIEQADRILNEYKADGYDLTLRQLYYQFVSMDLIENSDRSYDKLGRTVSDGRLAGYLDWSSIEDRTRKCVTPSTWETAADILETAELAFKLDCWATQPDRVEVWVEKEALANVVERACREYDIPWFCCRGYVSQSAMFEAAQRHIEYDVPTHILYLGDHDPSGIDMPRDIADRMELFRSHYTHVHPIALTMEQIEELNPPPNPAKLSDKRAAKYVAEFGNKSWELDALKPKYINDLISDKLSEFIDFDAWEEITEEQERQRKIITEAKDSV